MLTIAEIRLEIYRCLLLYRHRATKSESEEQASPSSTTLPILIEHLFVHKMVHKPFDVDDILNGRRAVRPPEKVLKLFIARWDKNPRCEVAPQILLSCKQIRSEATSVLYKENIFHFKLPDFSESNCTLQEIERMGRGPQIRKAKIEPSCKGLFAYSIKNWFDVTPIFLREATLAIFIRKIGKKNAASLARLTLGFQKRPRDCYYEDRNAAATSMRVVTELIRQHGKGLKQIEICFRVQKARSLGEAPGRWSEESVMLDTLDNLAERVSWIKRLDFQNLDETKPAAAGLLQLKWFIENRIDEKDTIKRAVDRFNAREGWYEPSE